MNNSHAARATWPPNFPRLALLTKSQIQLNKRTNPAGIPIASTLFAIPVKHFTGKMERTSTVFLCKKGVCRFSEIHKAYPQISKTMLSSVLKQLESDGLVIRKQYDEMPVRTEYSLTEAGQAFMPVFYEMFKWGLKYRNDPELDAMLSEFTIPEDPS